MDQKEMLNLINNINDKLDIVSSSLNKIHAEQQNIKKELEFCKNELINKE